MKILVFSSGVDFYLCLGVVSFKMESSNQEISLQRKSGNIYLLLLLLSFAITFYCHITSSVEESHASV